LEEAFLRIESSTKQPVRETMLLELGVALRKRFIRRQMDALRARQVAAEKAGEAEISVDLGQQIAALKMQYSQGVEST
jgi:hypothetical protein